MNHMNDSELVLALDGEMEEAELKHAVDHLAECGACRERWEKLQGLSARMVEYSASLYEPAKGAQAGHPLVENAKVFTVPAWSWGLVAAAVLVAASVTLWNASHSSNANETAKKATARSFVAKNAPQDDKTAEPAEAAKGVVSHKAYHPSRKGHAQSGAPAANQNAANQFTELPFSNAALPLDQATVVRVTLPAAALRQVGVAVNEDSGNAMLQADVVLGMDGLPRGIRLVNKSSGSGTMN